MDDGGAEPARSQVLHGLRIATLLVSAVIALGLGGANMVRHLAEYELPLVQVGSYVVLGAVFAVAGAVVGGGLIRAEKPAAMHAEPEPAQS
jgi:hypothetical protein